MHAAGGYAVIVGPEGRVEMDTFTCAHCGGIVHQPPERSLALASLVPAPIADLRGDSCLGCLDTKKPGSGRLCKGCTKAKSVSGRCTPLEKRIEAMERHFSSVRARDELFRELDIQG